MCAGLNANSANEGYNVGRCEMTTARFHVAPNSSGAWAVLRSGASRASRVFKSQADAVAYARRMARKAGSSLYVHRLDGTIQHRDSYGPDPAPPLATV